MIITIYARGNRIDRSMLAANLAAMGAAAHRKVAVIDATAPQYALQWGELRKAAHAKPKLPVHAPPVFRSDLENPHAYLRTHYQDIVIDADGVDRLNTDSALVASQLAVLPLWFQKMGPDAADTLLWHLMEVRLFNPTLHILLVRVRSISASGDEHEDMARAADFAKRIPGAVLAQTVLHERWNPRRAFDAGLTLFEDEPVSDSAVAELTALHGEIAQLGQAPAPARGGAELSEAVRQHIRGRWLHQQPT
jgi:chromosome partitioning protein